jgi:hypothetical protein
VVAIGTNWRLNWNSELSSCSTEYTCGQEDNRLHQRENSFDREAQNAEGKQEQPNERVRNERKKCQRPADKEEEQPEQECNHGELTPGQ